MTSAHTSLGTPAPGHPAGAEKGWIASVPPDEATGQLAQAYQKQQEKLGRVTELTQIGSLYPALVATRLALYEVVDATPSNIPEWARRAVALLTSVLNGCRFCTVGHTERLMEDGYGPLAESIKSQPETASSSSPAVDALLAYARKLVRRPGEMTEQDILSLRDEGWSDLDILDVNNIAAYYSYINRVASGLGLTREA
jgi:uncharacterized peroxidase-related enzyme